MQWDGSRSAGFTSAEPWLPLSPSSSKHNVAVEIDLRRSRAALVTGAKRLLEGPDNVIAYERAEGKERLLVALNLGREPREIAVERATVLLSTRLDREGERLQGRVRLRGDEGLLVELSR